MSQSIDCSPLGLIEGITGVYTSVMSMTKSWCNRLIFLFPDYHLFFCFLSAQVLLLSQTAIQLHSLLLSLQFNWFTFFFRILQFVCQDCLIYYCSDLDCFEKASRNLHYSSFESFCKTRYKKHGAWFNPYL
jgi:hypothetical protein